MKQLSPIILLALSACATMQHGTTEQIAVQTEPFGAECRLANKAGTWTVTTPGFVTVQKSASPLVITCTHEGVTAEQSIAAKVDAATHGNAIAGGLIGSLIDAQSGAMYLYPQTITVAIKP